jgi:hypothetical protein
MTANFVTEKIGRVNHHVVKTNAALVYGYWRCAGVTVLPSEHTAEGIAPTAARV